MGMFRRLANSLFMAWRLGQPRPAQKTTIDFQTVMEENNLQRALRFVSSKRPTLRLKS